MKYGKIPVWVYTAKNGYAWQGLEEGEDRATAAALDKALAAAGRVAGAWGAIVRRPVASRRWAEWPRSRLCWVLFRFHPEAGRDQRGRSCNYTAAACIPAGAGLPKLDFGKLFASPAMSEVRGEGLDRLWIDLDGEDADCLLAESTAKRLWEEFTPGTFLEGMRKPPEPPWTETWESPLLLREDVLPTLSRWCQGDGVDAGDLKVVLRTGEDGAGTLAAHAAYSVYPQVAAVHAAEEEWRTVRSGGGAAVRQALEKWHGALGSLGELNRALGGLEGLSGLIVEAEQELEKAEGAAKDAERSARMAAASAASEETSAGEIERKIAGFRMEKGKDANRRKLDTIKRGIEDGQRRFGHGQRWNALERNLEELCRRVYLVEGCLDTVSAYQQAALGGRATPALERDAAAACGQARELGLWGNGTFAQDVLNEMDRLYRIGHDLAAGNPAGGEAPAASGRTGTGYGMTGLGLLGEHSHRHHHRKGAVRRWTRQWSFWLAVSAASLAVILLVPWWMKRKSVRENWDGIRQAACELARDAKYSDALGKLEKGAPAAWKRWVLLLPANKEEAHLREQWIVLKGLEPELARAIDAEQSARKRLERFERAKKSEFAKDKSLAEEEWRAYEVARNAAEGLHEGLRLGDNGILPGTQEKDWAGLAARYSTAANQWGEAEKHFLAACQKIYLALNPTLEDQRAQMLAKYRGKLDEAWDSAEDERRLLVALEDRKGKLLAIAIGQDYAAQEWKTYKDCRRLAEDLMANVVYDEHGWPGRKTDAGDQPLPLDEKELTKLAEDYRSAAQAWKDAFTAYDQACTRIEKAFNDDRRKLIGAIRQNDAARVRLEALEQDVVRFKGAQKCQKARNALKQYGDFATQAEQLETGIRIKDGLPFPMPLKLQKDQLSNLCSKLDAARSNWTRAAQALSKAYEILDKEKEEEMDAAAEEAAEADTEAEPAQSAPPVQEATPIQDVTPAEPPPPPEPPKGDSRHVQELDALGPGFAEPQGRRPKPRTPVVGPSEPDKDASPSAGAPAVPVPSDRAGEISGEGPAEEKSGFFGGVVTGFKTVGRVLNPFSWGSDDSESGAEADHPAAGGDMPPRRPVDKKEAGQ